MGQNLVGQAFSTEPELHTVTDTRDPFHGGEPRKRDYPTCQFDSGGRDRAHDARMRQHGWLAAQIAAAQPIYGTRVRFVCTIRFYATRAS